MAAKKIQGPDKQDILRAAQSMIANHGNRAAEVAHSRALNLGDEASEARMTWEAIFHTLSRMNMGHLAHA
jgi:hypothetical protein